MPQAQIDRVRDTFVHVLFDPDRAAALFYDRLFTLAPDARALFGTDMTEQGRVLIKKLATIVTALDRFDGIAPGLRELAIRHVGYGAEARHYPLLADAMMHMLAIVAGDEWDASAQAAWQEAITVIAETMLAAAYPPDAVQLR